MDVREICQKLKPILGDKADRYWLTYLAEDMVGKRDIEMVLNMLAAKHLGSKPDDEQTFLAPPDATLSFGEYSIGNVLYNDRVLHPFGLRDEEWIQHVAVFGRSGAGKTNTVFILIENLLDRKKPFLIFDWKRNYRDLLAVRNDNVLVYTVGRDAVPFAFNPLIPPEGTDAQTWLKKLIEIVAHAYYVGEGVMFMLQESFHAVYEDFKVYDGKPEKYPTFEDVLGWLEEHPAKGRKALWMDSALRCLKSICFGHMGSVVKTAKQPNIGDLLEKNVILELDSLTNSDKTLIIESLLLWIHHYRLCQPERETFKHVMIIEEAHHILLKRTGAGSGGEAITDTILREIRELGESIVLVDQHPSMISVPAMGNTYATIALNVKHRSDVNALGGAMLLDEDQKELVGRLTIGQAIIKLQGRWLQPFLIQIPHRKIEKGSVNDSMLVQYMIARNVLKPYQDFEEREEQVAASSVSEITDRQMEFLVNVLKEPFLGTVERYRGLGLSRRKGNSVRESLVEMDLLSTVDIPTKSGKTVLVELTEKGKESLREKNHEVLHRSRWGGLEHEYWKNSVAERFRSDGWEVTIEANGGDYTDLVVENSLRKCAIEIETGKSDWKANIEKNIKKGFHEILILATRPDLIPRIENDVPLNESASIWVRYVGDYAS